MRQISAIISSNKELSPGIHMLNAEAPHIAALAQPGQFVMIRCGSNLTLNRPLSIHQVISNKSISFLFNVVNLSGSVSLDTIQPEKRKIAAKGEGTLWLSNRHPGDTLDLLGPLGNGFCVYPESKRLLLIAGGIGIAPLAYLARQALNQGKSVTLVLGSRTASGLYPRKLLPDELENVITTEDGSVGKKGKVTDVIIPLIDESDQIFACGPFPMYHAIFDLIQQNSINKNVQISLETRMGCGFGICFGCSIKTKHGIKTVCREGPIFNMEEILWQEVTL